ncbi:MAG: PP2C family protein-serine/threonine phosphatase [Bacteroidia bacterium]
MKQRLRKYFIGKFLTIPDPFERADAVMLYQFSLAFFLIFLIQLFTDILLGLHKATLKHSIDNLLLGAMPFVIRHVKKLEYAVNYFFLAIFITSFFATMMLNSESVDGICVSRVMFFILMSALLQRGIARVLFCCFFGWLPLLYVILNIKLNGALTWAWIVQPGAKELPVFIIFIPIVLGTYAIWNHTKTIHEAKKIMVKQKKVIEERNIAITDSINYAKRIQQARLPKRGNIKSTFPESLILFKPKDIVSGDFYYFNANHNGNFIASADCTGHGVPGAFMSLIGAEKLDDAVSQNADTSEILKQLNKGIKNSLQQSDHNESTRDGMDIALCSVDKINRIVKYAGANRPLWIIRKGQTIIEEIKATKKAIGGLTEDNQHFDTHEIRLQQGDTFYISSDGYADTFGGKSGKKLTTKKLKGILLSIQDKSMEDQELYLDNFIKNWKAEIEQVDDILIIGIRL